MNTQTDFEQWAEQQGLSTITEAASYAYMGWEARQKEIDALKAKLEEFILCMKGTEVHEKAEKLMNNLNWLPITELYKYAKEGALILALTDHGAAEPIVDGETGGEILSTYLAHAEGMGRVDDGYHVLVFGGEYSESDWESGIKFTIPAWWFLNDGNFETPGNPIKFIPLIQD